MQDEMTDSASQTAHQDLSAVAAVRGGDAERYRELVERHERRVYAVAWSRLGDAALAEEVTQEAFIRAYRRLWLLGDGAKFSGWVATIARRVAINFGLRHRRELNKRERWALENLSETAPDNSSTENEPLHSPETLRQTLAELPAAHRECLVLFYLEGKSGAEAAATLGISETALRVRLHRARAALRERLEEKLEGSLEKLRPAKTLVPAIMASVLASSSAKAATAGGAGLLGVLAKFTPFKWVILFLPLVFPVAILLPGYLMQQWRMRDELKNYRDAGGFRARLHQQGSRRLALIFLVMILGMFGLMYFLNFSPVRLDIKHLFLLIGCLGLWGTLVAGRMLEINRSWNHIGVFANGLILAGAGLAVGFGWMPVSEFMPFCMISVLITMFSTHQRPLRMDYNLFLRGAQEMFPQPPELIPPQPQSTESIRGFARFLAERHLVSGFGWLNGSLRLTLPVVGAPTSRSAWGSFVWNHKKTSGIALNPDGRVTVHCGEKDAAALLSLAEPKRLDLNEVERRVSDAVAGAWQYFLAGEFSHAESALGQVPDEEIFVRPAGKLLSRRWTKIIFGGVIAGSLLLTALTKLFPDQLEKLNGLYPVNLTEAQVHQFMSLVSTNPNPLVPEKSIGGGKGFTQKAFQWEPFFPLSCCMLLPETNLFTPRGLQAMHATVIHSDLASWRQNPNRIDMFCGNSLRFRALAEGWLSWQDLGLQPADCEAYLHSNRNGFQPYEQKNWDRFFSRGESWSWVKSERFPVMRIQSWGANELRFLRTVNSLDLIDRDKIIQQITLVQTLSAKPPGQPPIHDWKDVRGLFFTPCWPALLDTYYSLAALDALGGLDKIDREACIKGILRVHHGKGFFKSPDSGSYNEYHIDGSAQDTIAAYESLRILGALDRVKDLDEWQFRVNRRHLAKNEVTWRDIEAWVATQRLEKILRAHKASPAAPFRSLLEP